MTSDKDLFKYELAIVSALKFEAPYVKEWIDYHLLAGVDHFYIYNNDDDVTILEKILQPYIEKGLVNLVAFPGKRPQMAAFQDAVHKYKFECRYMTFLDGDEFIYPLSNKSIMEVVNEIMDKKPLAGSLSIYWQFFGSSGQEKADFNRGVLERFLYRASNERDDECGKIIVDPRSIKEFITPHYVIHFDGMYTMNELGEPGGFEKPVTAEKIVINHYHFKSREEYANKQRRGSAYQLDGKDFHTLEHYDEIEKNYNEVYDEGILHYKKSRQDLINKDMGGGGQPLSQRNQRRFISLIRILSPIAVFANLSPTMLLNGIKNFSKNNLVDFLTCWSVSKSLYADGFLPEEDSKSLEELSLQCVYGSLLNSNFDLPQIELLIEELPEIFNLEYPIVTKIKEILTKIIPELMWFKRMNMIDWTGYKNLNYILRMLKT